MRKKLASWLLQTWIRPDSEVLSRAMDSVRRRGLGKMDSGICLLSESFGILRSNLGLFFSKTNVQLFYERILACF